MTLHGTGGVGKSRLALQAAYEALETGQFKDGITFVPLDSLTSADLIPSSLAEALKLTLSGQDDTLTQVIRVLSDKHSLIILDNFEHLIDGVTQIDRLLNACPNLKLIVTSRERLRLEQEWVLTLTGLTLPEDETEGTVQEWGDTSPALPENEAERLEQLQNYDALNLFSQSAKRTRLDFTLTNDDLPNALKICQLVEGFPLGIELATVWVKLLPLSEMASEIEKNKDILSHSSRNALERHQSIRAVFQHSWNLLTRREQDVLKKLSVFVGGFRREAAAEVADATLPVLASLVDKSLLRVMPNGRYDRHPLLYQFEREKLEDSAYESVVTEQKHTEFFCTYLIRQSEAILGPQQQTVVRNLDSELGNIYAAWSHFFEENLNDQLYIAVNTLCEYLSIRGRLTAGIKLFEDALRILEAKPQEAPPILIACLYRNIGWLMLETGDVLKAQPFSEQALSLFLKTGYLVETALTLRHLGNIHFYKSELPLAKKFYEKELQIRVYLGSSIGLGATLQNLGYLLIQLGQYSEAESYIIESIRIGRQVGSLDGLATYLDNLGSLYLLMDRPSEAERAFQESLKLSQELGYDRIVPLVLNGFGWALYRQGKTDEGSEYIYKALKQANQTNSESALAVIATSYAKVKVDIGDFVLAEEYLVQAVTIAHRLSLKAEMFSALTEHARLLAVQGHILPAFQISNRVALSTESWWSTKQEAKKLAERCNKQLINSPASSKVLPLDLPPQVAPFVNGSPEKSR